MQRRAEMGFTLIELLVVVAAIGMLAMLALPSFQERAIRAQVVDGVGLVDFAMQGVAAHYAKYGTLPSDNEAAGLPPPDRMVVDQVSSVEVMDGVVDITFGNQANRALVGKTLTLRPAIMKGFVMVPIVWVCGMAEVPKQLHAISHNATNLPNAHLPLNCRANPGHS